MKNIIKILSSIIIFIPVIVIFGWFINNIYLKCIVPGLTPMNPVTAVCFILIGCSLLIYVNKNRYANPILRLVGLFVMGVGVIMTLKYVFNIDLHIDQVVFKSRLGHNRLAPNTAVDLIISGLLLILLTMRKSFNKTWLYPLIVLNALLAAISIIGYLYGVKYLFGVPGLNPMALHTAFGFILFDISLLLILLEGKKLYITKILVLTLLCGLVLEAGASVLAQSGVRHSEVTQQKTTNIYQAEDAINIYELAITLASTGQREYVLNGGNTYIASYNAGVLASKTDFSTLVSALKKINDASPSQLAQIESNANLRIAELGKVIQLRQSGNIAASTALYDASINVPYLNNIRSEVSQISTAIHTKLTTLSLDQADSYSRLSWIFSITTLLNISFILLAAYLIQDSISKTESARQQIKQHLEATSAEKAKSEALLASIGDGVFAIDKNHKVILFNKAASELTGFAAEDVIGKIYNEVLKFIQEDTGKDADTFIKKALAGQHTNMAARTVIEKKNGELLEVADSAAPIQITHHGHGGVIVVFRDVTKERALEKAQDEFVSLTSHQLRTPLTSIRLFIELLEDTKTGELNAQQADFISKVDISTKRMISLVGDILNLSRIQLGKLKIEPKPTDVIELTKELIEEIKPVADERSSQVVLESTDESFNNLNVDPNLLSQVIHNFLSNALRYTDVGKGVIKVNLTRETSTYKIAVTDNGIGVPKEAQSKLFDRFYRADNAIKVEGEGTGLGLYLVKMIMENSGGSVGFDDSHPGHTTFYVKLPLTGMVARSGTKAIERS